MRKSVLLLVMVLSACSSHRRVDERFVYERRDTLHAVLGEDLTVCLDDLRIIPPDTVRPRVEAVKVRIERRRDAVVDAAASQATTEVKVAQPASSRGESRLWFYALCAVCGFLLGRLSRHIRS